MQGLDTDNPYHALFPQKEGDLFAMRYWQRNMKKEEQTSISLTEMCGSTKVKMQYYGPNSLNEDGTFTTFGCKATLEDGVIKVTDISNAEEFVYSFKGTYKVEINRAMYELSGFGIFEI